KPDLIMNILALLSTRLREFTIQVENLSLKEIPGRLAAYLLYLSKEQGNKDLIKLNISKVQLANLLGTGPESLSRALGDMRNKELIEVKGASIRLINRALLQELAERGKASR
ncbi:MAG: Crp/Fnr family transcriptional regulator, partial [Deltaproteobacteria bacterium]|nr:Crp/Fnr family transcriptional regulator [Deltaproteobacteria bacterium]